MAKRGNGEGTIYYSEKLNKWVGQFSAGRKENGKLNRKSVYGNTRKEVKEKMTKALAEVQANSYIDKSNITIAELGKSIIELKFNSNRITETTYSRSLNTFNIIKNEIGDIPIQEIEISQLQNFINKQKTYSNSYINKIYEMLSNIFKEGIKNGIIAKNPMLNILKPKSIKQDKKIDALTIEEQKLFTSALENEQYKNIFLIALHSGMRIGEILALTINDIDLDNKLVHITNTLTKDSTGKVKIGETTKTYESMRDIPITTILEPILNNSISNYISNKNKLLFCHSNGSMITPSTINTQFKKICKNAGIKVITVKKKKGIDKDGNDIFVNLKTSTVNTHMLRHTYATRCIESGVPAEILQKLLGHKNISITLNTYTTIFNKFKVTALDNYINYINNI